jgi:hypothetical protein
VLRREGELFQVIRPSAIDKANPFQKSWHASDVHQKFNKIRGPIVIFGNKNRIRVTERRRLKIVRAARARILAWKLAS